MPTYFFRVRKPGEDEVIDKWVNAPDYTNAVISLARWCPGIELVKFEGQCLEQVGNA